MDDVEKENWISGDLSVRGGHLFVEDCNVMALVEQFGSPIYVVSEATLRRNCREWTAALAELWPEGPGRIYPSIKANISIASRTVLTEEGACCDVFGENELYAALKSGVKPERISLNGTAKTRPLLRRAIELGTRITIDHPAEASVIIEEAKNLGKVAKVRIRVRFAAIDIEGDSEVYAGVPAKHAIRIYKTGVPLKEGIEIARDLIASPHTELLGLHCHVGRHRMDLDFWRDVARCFAATAVEYHKVLDGWVPKEIDLGGGYPPRMDPTGRKRLPREQWDDRIDVPAPRDYVSVLTRSVRDIFTDAGISTEGMAFEVEPGRAIYQNSSIHLAEVQNVKFDSGETPKTWIETNTSVFSLADVTNAGNYFPVYVANKMDAQKTGCVDVVGISCASDFLAMDVEMPDIERDDVIAFVNTGAYLEPAASNFNAMPRPAMVMVNGDQAAYIKRPETVEDIFRREQMPDWLTTKAEGETE